MLGLVCYRDAGEKNGVRTLCGVRFCAVYVVRGGGLRAALSANRAARYLKKHRIRCAVFPPDFPAGETFARCGVLPPGEMALRRIMAPEIILCAMAQLGLAPENSRLALVSAAESAALETAALSLARTVRYLTLCAPGGGRIARTLRWDCGASVHTAPPDAPLCAGLAVAFDSIPLCCTCPVLRLEDETLGVRWRAPLPAGAERWDARQLLLALFAAGALKREEITVEAVELPAETV